MSNERDAYREKIKELLRKPPVAAHIATFNAAREFKNRARAATAAANSTAATLDRLRDAYNSIQPFYQP